jgi:hypothetical protein
MVNPQPNVTAAVTGVARAKCKRNAQRACLLAFTFKTFAEELLSNIALGVIRVDLAALQPFQVYPETLHVGERWTAPMEPEPNIT